MSTTIESLELEVLSSSQSAESGLDKLTASLEKLKTATKGGLGLTAVAKQLKSVKDATSGINSESVSNVTGLAKAIELLGGVKVSSTIAKQITAVSTALNGADFTSGETKIKSLVDTLAPLSQLPKNNLSSYVNSIKKLPEALEKLDTRTLYTKIQSLTRIMQPLAAEMQKIANGFSVFPTKIQKLIVENDKLIASNKKTSLSYTDLYSKLKMAAKSVITVATKISSAIREMNTYIENINLFTASMGEYASEAKKYAENVGEIMGIDPGEWMRNQGIFMTLATGFGIAGDRAALMSQQLTQLGYDLASFYNLSGGVEEAMDKLKSGFSGELEPLRNLGYDLSQAKLQAVALSLGIDKSVSSMTQAEKAQLRYYAIMTQVTTVHGDMARTLSSPANQLRIFKAQVTQAARAIGSIFIPALNAMLPYIIAATKVVRILASVIASLFGFEMPEVDYSSVDMLASGAEDTSDALDTATKSAKKLKSYMLGFDELNVVNPNTDSEGSGLGDVSGGEFNFELPTYDFIGGAAESRVAQIVEDMKKWLGITDDIDSWSELMDTRLGNILTTVGLIGGAFLAWKLTKTFLDGISTIKTLLDTPSYAIAIGAAITFTGFTMEFAGIKDAITNGLDGFNFAEIVGGALLGTGGAALLGSKIATWIGTAFKGSSVATALSTAASNLGVGSIGAAGAAIAGGVAAIIAGIPAFITGIYDSLKNGIDWLSATLTAAGATLAGAGIGAIIGALGGPIGAGFGALIGLAVGLITDGIIYLTQNWDSVVAWFDETCDKIGKFFSDLWTGIKTVFGTVKTWFSEKVITPVKTAFSKLWTSIKSAASTAWTGIKTVFTSVKAWFNDKVITPVKTVFSNLWSGIKTAASSAWTRIKTIFTPVKTWFSTLFGNVKKTISDVFYNIKVIAKGCWTTIKTVWQVAKTWFYDRVVTPVRTIFKNLWSGIKTTASIAWTNIKTIFHVVKQWFKATVVTPVKTIFSNLWSGIKTAASSAWTGVKNTFSSAKTWFNTTVVTPVKNVLSGIWTGLKNGASAAWTGVKNVFSSVGSFFKTTFQNAWSGVVKVFSAAGNVFTNIKDGIVSAFKTVVNTLIRGINKVVSVPFNAINTALTKVKNVSILGMQPFADIRTINVPSIPLLAQGGFPDAGQMFIAREAGPELVGNIGSRNAVVNNDQIVESVSTGVYQAVVAALANTDDDSGNTPIVVNLDGEKIYENQQKIARGRGYNLGMGAFSFG